MKFEKVFIHIGLHKTASTYLQEVILSNTPDILYLTRPYAQCNKAFNKLQYADDSLYSHEEFLDEISKLPSKKTLLLSDEAFSGFPNGLWYINRSIILTRLKRAFSNAIIILFIRGQKSLIKSHYNQYIKSGYGTLRLKHFIWKPQRNYTVRDSIENNPLVITLHIINLT